MPAGLVVVSGLARGAVRAVGIAGSGPRTVLVEYDLRGLAEGVVRRGTSRGGAAWRTAVLELAHGCVSCTLREDVVPLLRRLGHEPDVARVVLLLDPGMEPAAVCEALAHLPGGTGGAGGTVTEVLDLRGVVAVLDAATWLDDAGSDDTLAERGLALGPDDGRTVAQLAVGAAELADVVVLTGPTPDPWERVRRDAVLDRLAPTAVRLVVGAGPPPDAAALLADPDGPDGRRASPPHPDARRGVPDDPHGPLLRGRPPLHREAGVSLLHLGMRRPFHPGRLHAAFEVLLTGTVRARGRVWTATRPDHVLWLESAGGALHLGEVGRWLAADPDGWDAVGAERAAAASLRWDERFGDREQQLVVLVHEADPAGVVAALDEALLTDAELAAGEELWRTWDDPLWPWHADPCGDLEGERPRPAPDGRGAPRD